jgi:hypothetical protein
MAYAFGVRCVALCFCFLTACSVRPNAPASSPTNAVPASANEAVAIGIADGGAGPIAIPFNDAGLPASPPAVPSPPFSRVDVDAGLFVESIAVGDVDGNGTPDIVTANRNDFICDDNYGRCMSASVIRNNGDGTFQPQVKLGEPLYPSHVLVADLNGDHWLDLAVDTGGQFDVYLGNGDGTFASPTSYTDDSRGADAFVAADVNHDGALDIITYAYGAGAISVRLGNGDGTFGGERLVSGVSAEMFRAGDVNEDGYADLFYASQNPRSWGVALGQPDGTLVDEGLRPLPPPSYPQGLALGDVDGDGHLDAAVTNAFSHAVVIYLGDGRGNFTDAGWYHAGTEPGPVVFGDFDGDGKVDMFIGDAATLTLGFFAGMGGGAFAGGFAAASLGDTPETLVAGDFDGDGKLDLAVGMSDLNSGTDVTVLLNRRP